MMPRTNSSPRRGAALLTVLVTVAVLATVTAMASQGARQSAQFVAASRASTVAHHMAESGVLAARSRLEAQLRGTPVTSANSSPLLTVFDTLEETAPYASDTLGTGAFSSVIVNVSARLDVNAAGAEGLTTLFRTVAPPAEAARIAALLDEHVRGTRASQALRDSAAARDSMMQALLGRTTPRSRAVLPFESLDEVEALVGQDAPWLAAVAEWLTVDGDGSVDRRHAAPTVLRAASGSLVDRPTRLLIVSRGWALGDRGTWEIQAVYAVEGMELRLVRWREQRR